MPPIGAMMPKPVNAGPVSVPTQNMGNQVQASAAIKNAAEGLQQALLQLPMGSEQHTKLLKIVKDLASMAAEAPSDPHAQIQNLVAMSRKASQTGAPPGLASVMPAMPAPTPAGPAPDAGPPGP